MTVLFVALGAAVGAPLRYFVDRAIQSRYGSAFPLGTVSVNVIGSAVFGVIVGGAAAGDVPPWLFSVGGVGFCGALTTYSAFGYESVRLAHAGAVRFAAVNVVGSVAAGVGAAWLGTGVAEALWR